MMNRLFPPLRRLYKRSPRNWSNKLIFREVEDPDLIAKARRGDVEAYNLLVSRWEKRVYNYLLRLVSNREDALDVSQEVFLKAYQSLPKLDDPARFAGWLFRIAHNEAFSLLRRRRPETDLAGEPRPVELSPRLLPMELSLAVETALNRLSADQRGGPAAPGLSGVQVRGNGRNPGVPGFYREIAAVHGARSAQNDACSDERKPAR